MPGAVAWWSRRRGVLLPVLGIAGVGILLGAAQVTAAVNGFSGPLSSVVSDFVGTPKSATVPWAALALALVGLSARRRVVVGAAALLVDVGFLAVRAHRHLALTVGNGPTIVLACLAVYAAVCWRGSERRTALHAAALGALLTLASKVGDTWLQVTGIVRPTVLDRYVQLADHAFGNPSWVVGQALDAAGPVLSGVLHWVYIELPVAAMVIAVWQLRNVTVGEWPRHYLVRTFLVLGLVGPVAYLLFPVVGPAFAFGVQGHGSALGDFWPSSVPGATFSPTAIPFDRFTPRNCMPSMHTAWATTIFLHSRRAPRLLRWGGTFWLVCTATATLGFGYHYGADLVAGAVLCLTVESALRDPARGWDAGRIRMIAAGAGTFALVLLCFRYGAVQMAEYPELFGPAILAGLVGVSVLFHRTWAEEPVLARNMLPMS